MSTVQTDVYPFKEDLGKNLYRKKTYYTLCIEQEVLAKDKDEVKGWLPLFHGIGHQCLYKQENNIPPSLREAINTFLMNLA